MLSTADGSIILGADGSVVLSKTAPHTAALTFSDGAYDLRITPPVGRPCYRGIATAMKLLALHAARAWSCSEVRTFHHPKNVAIIAANRSLGFRDANFRNANFDL